MFDEMQTVQAGQEGERVIPCLPSVFFMTKEEVDSMKVKELKLHLEDCGLPTAGKKDVLRTKLLEAVEAASFHSVQKTKWLGKANSFQGSEVWAKKIPQGLLGVSSPDAQIVKNRMIALFQLQGMSKKKARTETMEFLRQYIYPGKSERSQLSGYDYQQVRERQQATRDYFYGMTGTYVAHKKNLEYIGNRLKETKKEVAGLKYHPVEYFLDAEAFKRYTTAKKRLSNKIKEYTRNNTAIPDDLKRAEKDNFDFGKLLMNAARSRFEATRYYQLGQRIKRLRAHRQKAVKKEINASIFYEKSQPWSYGVPTRNSFAVDLQEEIWEEWFALTSLIHPGNDGETHFFKLASKYVGQKPTPASFGEMGPGQSVIELAVDLEEERKLISESQAVQDEWNDFLSSL